MLKITLERVAPQQKHILFRMLQYSLFEESLTDLNEMNGEALFEYPWFDIYFTEADREAYFIRENVSRRLLGFAMINTHVQKSEKGHSIAEFMVIPKYRGRGIGKRAAMECFDKHEGSWEVTPAYGSKAAREFWGHVIDEYTEKNNTLTDGTFCFFCRVDRMHRGKGKDFPGIQEQRGKAGLDIYGKETETDPGKAAKTAAGLTPKETKHKNRD